jgi:Putative auto-transporter adhesin, head GIN domain
MAGRTISTVLASAALLLGSMPAMAAEKRFGLTSFERIVLNADVAVEVVTRSPVSAVAVGSPDALDRLELISANGTLTIRDRRFESNRTRGAGAGPVTIRVNAARLNSAAVVGAGSLSIDRLAGASVMLNLRGPGSLAVKDVAADRLALTMSGNGIVRLAGRAKNADIRVAGAGAVDAAALIVTDLTASAEGAGSQNYYAERTASVTARGVGAVMVAGKAACTVKNLGNATVTCGKR